MELSSTERSNCLYFLKTYTTYSNRVIYDMAKDDGKLMNVTSRIRECMERYPKDIMEYLNAHPECPTRYTYEQLKQMKYNELAAIRKSFKIRKSAKKVVKVEQPTTELTKARASLHSNPSIEKTIICDVLTDPDELQFLTPEEIEMMYPGSGLLTNEELNRMGIARENASEYQEIDEDEYYIKIATIVDSGLVIDDKPITIVDCYNMSVEQVEKLYEQVKSKQSKKESKRNKKF